MEKGQLLETAWLTLILYLILERLPEVSIGRHTARYITYRL